MKETTSVEKFLEDSGWLVRVYYSSHGVVDGRGALLGLSVSFGNVPVAIVDLASARCKKALVPRRRSWLWRHVPALRSCPIPLAVIERAILDVYHFGEGL